MTLGKSLDAIESSDVEQNLENADTSTPLRTLTG